MNRVALASVLCALIVCSCSIKEDRSVCPCWLEVNLSQVKAASVQVSLWNKNLYLDEMLESGESHNIYEFTVPRKESIVSTYVGVDKCSIDSDKNLIIPYGEQMGCLYAESTKLYTDAESLRHTVILHKQYSTIFVTLEGVEEDVSIKVTANTKGVSLKDLKPIYGDFCFNTDIDNGEFIFRVPRQYDNSLTAYIIKDDSVLETINIGKYLESIGFDWTAEDLPDIRMKANIPDQKITISISGWDMVTFEIVI